MWNTRGQGRIGPRVRGEVSDALLDESMAPYDTCLDRFDACPFSLVIVLLHPLPANTEATKNGLAYIAS